MSEPTITTTRSYLAAMMDTTPGHRTTGYVVSRHTFGSTTQDIAKFGPDEMDQALALASRLPRYEDQAVYVSRLGRGQGGVWVQEVRTETVVEVMPSAKLAGRAPRALGGPLNQGPDLSCYACGTLIRSSEMHPEMHGGDYAIRRTAGFILDPAAATYCREHADQA